MVRPFWTDWVRSAVEGGGKRAETTDTHSTWNRFSRSVPLGRQPRCVGKFFGDSARTYVDLFEDATSRISSSQYTTADLLADGTRYWSQLSKDWARAWSNGLEMLDEVGREGLDARLMPPGAAREPAQGVATAMTPSAPIETEGTIVAAAGIGPTDRPVSSDLVSIEAGGATIVSTKVVVSVQPLEDGTYGARYAPPTRRCRQGSTEET